MTDKLSDLVQGTLDMLILKTLALEPMHGYGIAVRIEQTSKGVFRVNAGSLFIALQRLQRAGLIKSDWKATENNRRARYYALTEHGRKKLQSETLGVEQASGRDCQNPGGVVAMSFLRNIASGTRSLFRKHGEERELGEEVHGFVEMAVHEKMEQGMSRQEALRAVRLEHGTVEVTKEKVRSASWDRSGRMSLLRHVES